MIKVPRLAFWSLKFDPDKYHLNTLNIPKHVIEWADMGHN